MNETILTVLIGVATGSAGYFVTTFWMRPVLRFGEIRQQIASDLVFFANAITSEGLNEELRQRVSDRRAANRRTSADLMACLLTLPFWYRWWLKLRKRDSKIAAEELIGLSNTVDHSTSDTRIAKIKAGLGLP